MKTIEPNMNDVMNNLFEFTTTVLAPTVYSDEWIERCAEVYQNMRIANYGITFEQFVANPRKMLRHLQNARDLLASADRLTDEAKDRIDNKRDRNTKNHAPAIRYCGCRLMQPMYTRQALSKKKTGHTH